MIVVSRDTKGNTDTVALEILDTNGNAIVTGAARASRVAWNEWKERLVKVETNESQWRGEVGSPLSNSARTTA
jgi:hypothetical protein